MNEIPAEWEHIATEAIAKQRRVDQLLRQPSKDEWFAKAVIDDVYPLIAAAERTEAARDVAILEDIADDVFDLLGRLPSLSIDHHDEREQLRLRIREARAYVDEQAPGGGDNES